MSIADYKIGPLTDKEIEKLDDWMAKTAWLNIRVAVVVGTIMGLFIILNS